MPDQAKSTNFRSSPLVVFVTLLMIGCTRPELANPGLFAVTESNLPPAVRSASEAVFRVMVFSESKPRWVPLSELSGGMALLERKRDGGELHDSTFQNLRILAEDFRQSGRTHDDMDYRGQGTAFVSGDRRTLWTCAHVVRMDPDVKEGNQVAWVLLDSLGRIRFDSRHGRARATVRFLGSPDRLRGVSNLGVRLLAGDVARVELDRPLDVTPIPPVAPTAGTEVFAMGYPRGGTGREVGGSRSNVQRFGRGVILDHSRLLIEFEQHEIEQADPDARRYLIFSTADGDHGQSGGPILDSRGRAVGILRGGVSYLDQSAHDASGAIAVAWTAVQDS